MTATSHDSALPLFDYATQAIAHARHRDPETSKEAAKTVDVTQGQTQVLRVLEALGKGTDEQIFEALQRREIAISPSGARTRRSELVAAGKIRFTGEFADTRTGRKSRVWAPGASD